MLAKACVAKWEHRFSCLIAVSVTLVFAFVFANQAYAGRPDPPPVGDMLRQAELVIAGDIKEADPNSSFTVVRVRRILKGKIPGSDRDLRVGPIMQMYEPLPPKKDVTLLLRRVNWTSEYDWYPVMAYFEQEDIHAVQTLCALYTVRDERRRLLELFAMARRDVPLMKNELLADIRAMTDPTAFPVVLDIYAGLRADDQKFAASTKRTARDDERFKREKHLNEHDKRVIQSNVEREFYRKLYLEAVAGFGDNRVLPLLIQALGDNSLIVGPSAAEQLYKHYRETPEVKELLARGNVEMSHVRAYALFDDQLKAHDPYVEDWAVSDELVYATKLRLVGDHAEARKVYWRAVERWQKDSEASMAALALLDGATPAERDKIRVLVLPHATKRFVGVNNTSQQRIDVRLLRTLGDPASLPVLIKLIHGQPSSYDELSYNATMAISELGPQARKQAVAQILTWMATDNYGELVNYVNLLLWLGTADDLGRAASLLEKKPTEVWPKSKPELPRLSSQDEVQFFIDRLGPNTLPYSGPWPVRRLGELGDARAIEPLVKSMVGMSLWSPSVFGTEEIENALIRLPGKQVAAQMLLLLQKTDGQSAATAFVIPEDRLRSWRAVDPILGLQLRATRVLLQVQGAPGIPMARDIVAGKAPGSKAEAIKHLGWFGTKEDIALLQPFRDYWRGDRELHARAMSASALLRARFSDEWLVDPEVVHPVRQPVEVRSHRCFLPELPCY